MPRLLRASASSSPQRVRSAPAPSYCVASSGCPSGAGQPKGTWPAAAIWPNSAAVGASGTRIGPRRGGHRIQRPAHPAEPRVGDLRPREDGAHHAGDLVGGGEVAAEGGDGAGHHGLRHRLADQPADQLGADEAGGRRVLGQRVQHRAAMHHGAGEGLQRAAEEQLLVLVVPGLDEGEFAGVRQPPTAVDRLVRRHRPAGEGPRRLPDIGIDIAGRAALGVARHVLRGAGGAEIGRAAEGVQLQQLAGVVLVRGPGAGALVVQEEQHRRRGRRRLQQGAEIAQRLAADAPVVGRSSETLTWVADSGADREMVEPELDQPFAQLRLGLHLADQGGDQQLQPAAIHLGRRHRAVLARGEAEILRLAHGQPGQRPVLLQRRPAALGGGVADRQADGGEPGLDRRVLGRQGQLVLDPGGQALAGQRLGLARPGAIGGAAEDAVGGIGAECGQGNLLAKPRGGTLSSGARAGSNELA